ncbi:uncharacterized protein AKAW2_40403S [Aspergillus luchuensis]|uniref:Uncharacterized protein n=1 Tax=Aspergillus kawachii TaxID=1069201 RepID=A0A7R7ZY27_ASPKA|nr:uncharacterized protein AKAW2_40403S [Aspergillus luchuensis]BCR98720.1 hypothetical protein AKAW2_40403S [Aspergillus luchuensis]
MSLATPTLSHALVLIFAISFSITAAYNIMNILIVDLYYSTPATAMAANNLVRCFLGAAATGLVHPAMVRWGTGWTYGMVGGMVGAVVCPLLGWVYVKGMEWRCADERYRPVAEE